MARQRAGLKRPAKNVKSSPREKKAKESSDSEYEYEESSPSTDNDDDNDEDYDEEEEDLADDDDEEEDDRKPEAKKSKKTTKSMKSTNTTIEPTSAIGNNEDPAEAAGTGAAGETPPAVATKTKTTKVKAKAKKEPKPKKEPAAKKKRVEKPRPYKKKVKIFDLSKDEGLTSTDRKTSKGGYAHTELSRSKISKANSGNVPWNKGKNRSSATIAKIAAGVRARNRAILLEKLKRLGMTEEEYLLKKKEIKHLREKVRKARQTNEKHKLADMELKLKAALDSTNEAKKKEEDAKAAKLAAINKRMEKFKREQEVVKDKAFTRAVIWTPFSFVETEGEGNEDREDGNDETAANNIEDETKDNKNQQQEKQKQQQKQEGKSYEDICPNGGPGGLICCEFCSDKYSSFLSETVRDIEVQKTHKCGKELQEIMKFLQDGKDALQPAMDMARKKVPPLPPRRPMPSPPAAAAAAASTMLFLGGTSSSSPIQGAMASSPTTAAVGARGQSLSPPSSASKKQAEQRGNTTNTEWNLTSTIDVAANQTAV